MDREMGGSTVIGNIRDRVGEVLQPQEPELIPIPIPIPTNEQEEMMRRQGMGQGPQIPGMQGRDRDGGWTYGRFSDFSESKRSDFGFSNGAQPRERGALMKIFDLKKIEQNIDSAQTTIKNGLDQQSDVLGLAMSEHQAKFLKGKAHAAPLIVNSRVRRTSILAPVASRK